MGSSNGFPPSLLRPGPPPKASLMSMASGYGDLAQNPATAAAGAPPAASAASTALVPAPHVDSLRSDPYGCWVVVYGFSGGAQLKAVLDRFGTYGTVLAQHRGGAGGGGGGGGGGGRYPPPPEAGGASGGASNWTCLRYETPLQAEKALCQHGTFLGGAGGSLLLVGVRPARPRNAAPASTVWPRPPLLQRLGFLLREVQDLRLLVALGVGGALHAQTAAGGAFLRRRQVVMARLHPHQT